MPPTLPASPPSAASTIPIPQCSAPRKAGAPALVALLLVVTCVTTADLLIKRGAANSHAAGGSDLLSTLGIAALASPFTISGILFHLAGLAAWMYALRNIPLTIAYCFTAVQQATIALGAWLWLGEFISPLRWVGLLIVMAGVLLLVPSIVQTEVRTQLPPKGTP